MFITEVKVMGDSGTEYTISMRNGYAACSCPSYQFGGNHFCKHIAYVAEIVAAGSLSGVMADNPVNE